MYWIPVALNKMFEWLFSRVLASHRGGPDLWTSSLRWRWPWSSLFFHSGDPDVQCCGSEFFPSQIPDPNFFFIPYPGSEFFHLWSLIHIKEFNYFNPKKLSLSSRKYDPGCSFRIRISDPDFLPIPDPDIKKGPDPGSGSATLKTLIYVKEEQIKISYR